MSNTIPINTLSAEEKRALLQKVLEEKLRKPRIAPLSFAQQRLWFLDKLDPDSPAYNVATVITLKGVLEQKPFRAALDKIVERHEALRTTFGATDDQPWQQVNPPAPVPFNFVDLRKADPESRREEADRLVTQEIKRPFALASDMMIRVMLIQLADEENQMVLVTHHIASDEWSMRALLNEWAILYEAFRSGKRPELPALPIQYADFSEWQREWAAGEECRQQLSYWREKLKNPPPPLQLPSDRPRPATQTREGALYARVIPAEILNGIKALGRQENTTLFMTLLAAFKVLLYRQTEQEDIIVGSPIAGRSRLESEPLIGFFVNTLPLRTQMGGEPTFRDLLLAVRNTTLEAYANQEIPFDKVVEELHPDRNSTHTPYVQVMFTLNNDYVPEDIFPGLKSEWIEVDTGSAKFDLTLIASETPNGLRVIIEYNTGLFDPARIGRFLGHYETLLADIAANPDRKITELELLTPAERLQLLETWNNTRVPYSEECIHQVFERQVARTPDAIAVQYGGESLTYRELNARANQLAHRLQKSKVNVGSLAGVYMGRSPELIIALLAILKAGGAYVPLDLSYPRERLAWMIEDTAMPVILTESALAGDLPGDPGRLICVDTEAAGIAGEPRQLPPNQATPESMAYVIYTSGSTGQPKGVVVPHRGVTRLVLNTDYVRLSENDRIAQASNASFDAATFEIWGALLNGGRVVGISKDVALSPVDFAAALRQEKITTLFLTTALFNQLAREVPGVFSTLDTVLFGGEAVDPKWVRAVLECDPPKRLLHVYGPTENTTFSTWYHVREVDDEAATVPIGKPIANSELYILDPRGRLLPVGVNGEVYTGGEGLALGYWNQPDLTARKFVPNPFDPSGKSRLYRTGDLARFDADGNVEFVGRVDHQVKIRGFRIELGEIESVLAKHPGVGNAVVMAREDVPGDRRLVAYIVPKGPAPAEADLKTFLKSRLPDFMTPAAFVFMESFPMTPNEKVDRKALPAPGLTRPDLYKTFVAPRDATEQQLAKIWEKILGIQPIGVADNFFDLGGHSLLAVRLFGQIEKAFGKKLPLATLFRAPTIEEIAAVLRDNNQTKSWSTIVDIQPKGSRPPFFWIHSLGGDGGGGFFYYRKLAELLGPDQPSFGIRSPQEPFHNIEEMAAFYVKEIRKFHPEGPFYLGGFCFGGIVAFEMAQQLTREGGDIGLLVMLETAPPNVKPKHGWTPASARHSFENLLENVKDFVNHSPGERVAYLKQKGRRLKQKLSSKVASSSPGPETQAVELKDVLDLTHYPRDYVKYAETHWQAMTQYHPREYPGEITLFRAKKQGLSNFTHTLGWEALVDDRVNVTVIPGTHESMLQEPNVQIVAAKLRSLLENAHNKHHSVQSPELAAAV